MVYNLTSPNSAEFIVQFTDVDGNAVSPSSAALTIVYISAGSAVSATQDMTENNTFWTATWNSGVADVPSNATWSVVSSVSSLPAQVGTLRIIDP